MIIVDEVSMVGSSKIAKINYRFQDLADGVKRNEFMAGISLIASGNRLKAKTIKKGLF